MVQLHQLGWVGQHFFSTGHPLRLIRILYVHTRTGSSWMTILETPRTCTVVAHRILIFIALTLKKHHQLLRHSLQWKDSLFASRMKHNMLRATFAHITAFQSYLRGLMWGRNFLLFWKFWLKAQTFWAMAFIPLQARMCSGGQKRGPFLVMTHIC